MLNWVFSLLSCCVRLNFTCDGQSTTTRAFEWWIVDREIEWCTRLYMDSTLYSFLTARTCPLNLCVLFLANVKNSNTSSTSFSAKGISQIEFTLDFPCMLGYSNVLSLSQIIRLYSRHNFEICHRSLKWSHWAIWRRYYRRKPSSWMLWLIYCVPFLL